MAIAPNKLVTVVDNAELALLEVKYKLVEPSVISSVSNTTEPIFAFTDNTASVGVSNSDQSAEVPAVPPL